MKATIKREHDADTKIIYTSASKIFGKDLVENLVETSNKHPGNIIYAGNPPGHLLLNDAILVKPDFYRSVDKGFKIIPDDIKIIETSVDYTFNV